MPVLKNKHVNYTLHYSEYKGHDAEIAEILAKETLVPWTEEQETIETFPLLIIVGGDGTLHQVLDTFYQMEVEFPVAYIPAGSEMILLEERDFLRILKSTSADFSSSITR